MTTRFVVLRSGGTGDTKTGEAVPRWETVGSALFYSLAHAVEFAAMLDDGKVFRLVPLDENDQEIA